MLGSLGWLAFELEITLTKQRASSTGGGSGSGGQVLPLNPKASEVASHLKATLVSWVKMCLEDHIACERDTPVPADDVASLAWWLRFRLNELAACSFAPDLMGEIGDVVKASYAAIDTYPQRQYLGTCACQELLFAMSATAPRVQCTGCGTVFDADLLRERVGAVGEDALLTSAEIADLAHHMGHRLQRETIRKRVNTWYREGRMEAHLEGRFPHFRLGDVWGRLFDTPTRREGA